MKYFYNLLLIFFFLVSNLNALALNTLALHENVEALPPTATITASSNSVCQNSGSVVITFTGSNGTAPYTFTYNINGGSAVTITTPGVSSSVTLSASTATAGTFNYNLISVTDSATPPLTQGIGSTATFIVRLKPDATLNGTGSGSVFNGTPVFRFCSNSVSTFNFTNGSSTTSINSSYTINWGDASPNFTSTDFAAPISHIYQIGLWNLTYTIIGSNGCSTTKAYIVFVGSNPAVSLGNPGNTDICQSTALTFPITGTTNNPPGTVYTVTFNDGSAPIVYDHPPPSSVTHTFLVSSCGTTSSDGSNSYPNSFFANIVASNPCSISSVGVVPIYVSTPPITDFTVPSPIVCTNSAICITNTSIGNENFGSGSSCDNTPALVWNISPSTGFTLSSGTLGNDFGFSDSTLWTEGSNSICPVFTVPGTYTITLKSGNRCGIDTEIKTICIESPLTPTFSLSSNAGCTPLTVTTSNTTNLANSCATPTYLWNVTYSAGNCGAAPATPFFASGSASSSATPTFNFVTAGTYAISLTTTNACGSVTSATQIVNVKKPPTASIGAIANFCGSASITPTATINNCAPTGEAMTYAWSFPGGSPSASSSAVPGTITYSTAGSYTVSLVVTNSCGSSATATQNFVINVAPTITNSILAQTICSGQQTTAITLTATPSTATFSWTATATAGVTGFIASGSAAVIPAQTIITSGSSPGTVTYTITPTIAGCAGPSVTYVITINPAPLINSQPIATAACQNATMNALTVGYANGTGSPTYQWYSNNSPSTTGGTLISGATNASFVPASANVGIVYYYVIVSFPSGGCSNITSNVAGITITAPITISTQPAVTQQVCVGGSIPALTIAHSGGTGAVSYQWYSNTSPVNTGGSLITGATSANYTPPAYTTAETYYYYAAVTMNGNGCGQSASNVATVIVVPDPTVSLAPSTQTLCQGATAQTLTATASGGAGSYSYQWYSNLNNNTTSGASIPGANASSYTPPTTAVGTMYYYCIVAQPTTPGCSATSTTVSVIVIAAPSITTQPSGSTVCEGGTPTTLSVAYANGVGTPTYQWYSNSTNSTVGSSPIVGATASSYTPSATIIGTVYYYVIITLPSSGGCSSITSNIAAVVITAPTSITTQPMPSQSICVGGAVSTALSVAYSGGTGTVSYQWFSNTIPTNTGGTSISGATSPSYTPPVFNTVGTFYYYAIVTLNGNGCGPASSNVAEVVVAADPTITVQPLATQTVCAGAIPASLTVVASGGVGTLLYQWYSNTTNSNTGGSPITGATTDAFAPPTTAVGTIWYYCIISTSNSGCSVTSATAAVIVNASPTFTTQPLPATVCQGGTLSALSVTYSNGTGTPAYQWYINSVDNTSTGTAIAGATTATYAPSSAAIGTLYYYVIITLPPSGGCSSIISNTALIEITPGTSITTQPIATQSICTGGIVPAPFTVTYSGGTGTATYQWFSNTTPTNAGGTSISGATAASYTPPVFNTAGTFYYYAVVTLSGNGCGPAASEVAEVIVAPDPIITTQPTVTQTLCQSAAPEELFVVVSGGIGALSYQWYSNTANSLSGGTAIAGATSNTFTPPTSIVGTMYYYVIISQTGVGCSATSATAEINVNLSPTISQQPVSQTVCEGASLATLSVSYINGTGTPTYQWYSNSTDDTTSGNPITGANAATFLPPASVVGVVYYYAIITLPSGGCSSIVSQTAAITINALPSISVQPLATQSLCVGGAIPAGLTVEYSGGTGTASYQWYSNATNANTGGTIIAGANATSYSPPAFAATGTYYYYAVVTLSGNGCGNVSSNPATVIVMTDPIIDTQPLATQEICQNATPADLSVTVSGGITSAYSYQWYSNTANNTTTGTLISGATLASFTPPTATTGTTYYYAIITQPAGAGCSVTSATAAVILNQAPAFVQQPASSTVCSGESATVMLVTYSNGAGIPQYQWYSNTVNSTTGGTPISGATSASYNPPSVIVGTIYYYVIVSLPAGGCTDIISDVAFVSVNANPLIASSSVVICSGTGFSVTPDNTGGNLVPTGTTYTWGTPVIVPSGSITGASAQTVAQTQIAQTLINGTTNPATVTYTVTPMSGLCTGADFTITVTVNPAISPNVTVANSNCYAASNGSIQTNITGGIPFPGVPYQITWTGPGGFTSSASSIFNLAPGVYSLTVNDAGGCPFTSTYTITEPAEIIITTDSENDITCFGDSDGAVAISVSGGTLPYIYTWTKNTIAFATSEDISNLGPGTYVISVTDANNCGPATATFTITEPPLLQVNLTSQTNVLCYGYSTGAITVSVTGGTLIEITPGNFGYNFTWTGPNGFTSTNQNLTAIAAGNYNLTVTDLNGCFKNLSVVITQTPEIVIAATTTPITCYGANNASITLTVSGGVGPYQATWSNLATGLFQNNLNAGTYVITITDALGCPKSITVVIPDAPVFMVNPIVQNISCFGANDGSINLNLTGGLPPVTMVWNDGSTAGLIRNNLAPGTYIATISDGTPCHITRTFVIIEPQQMALSGVTANAFDCNNSNSGSVNITVAGGTPPYTYAWSTGASTEDIADLTAGNYQVTVTDANGCSQTGQYSIFTPAPIAISIQTDTVANCATGYVAQTFTAQVSGGVAPYILHWSSGTISGINNEIMTTTQNTMVVLEVTDSRGCLSSYTFDVDIPIIDDAEFTSTSIGYETYGTYSIVDPIHFTNGAEGDYETISWNFGDGAFSTEENPTHSYVAEGEYVVTQTVTYPFGCVYTHVITLLVKKGYFLVVPNAFTPNADSVNDRFRPMAKGLKNVTLSVYDTWGSLIYSEEGTILQGWDGKIKGITAENGNYYCKVSAETFYGTIVFENHPFVLIN